MVRENRTSRETLLTAVEKIEQPVLPRQLRLLGRVLAAIIPYLIGNRCWLSQANSNDHANILGRCILSTQPFLTLLFISTFPHFVHAVNCFHTYHSIIYCFQLHCLCNFFSTSLDCPAAWLRYHIQILPLKYIPDCQPSSSHRRLRFLTL